VKDSTGADGVSEGMLTDGAMEEDALGVCGPLTGKFLFMRWYVEYQLLIWVAVNT